MMKPSAYFLNLQNKVETLFNYIKRSFSSLAVPFLWLSGANGISQVMSVIYSLLLARWLLPEGYGIFAGCYAAASLSSFLVNWGMDTWLLRQASTNKEPLVLTGFILKLKVGLGVVWAAGMWLVLTKVRPEFYLPSVLALVLMDSWMESGTNTISVLFNALRQTKTVSLLVVISRSLRLISAIGLILIKSSEVLPFVSIRLIFTTFVFIGALIYTKPEWRKQPGLSLKQMWSQLAPYASSDFLTTVYTSLDIFLISILIGKTATGVYAPALGLINALITLQSSAFWVFTPHLTTTYQEHPERMKKTFFLIILILLVAGMGISLILWLSGPWIIDLLLRQAYHSTGALLRIMSPILLLKSLSLGFAAMLVAVGKQYQRLIPQFVSASANFLLNLYVIPRWGPAGAAMVYFVSEVLLMLGYASQVFNFFRRNSIKV